MQKNISPSLIERGLDFARRHIILALSMKLAVGLLVGFGLGVYFLPKIIEEAPADETLITAEINTAEKQAVFVKNRADSDPIHWGEGILYLTASRATLDGRVSPGPDYRLYLTPSFVETGDDFRAIKSQSKEIARIKGFTNFSYELPQGVDINAYGGVIVWCERFGVYITSGPLEDKS
jgi:hypothetical protein